MAAISRKRRRQPQADSETTGLLGHNGLDQRSRKKRKISHTQARTTAVEDDHVVESHVGPSSRTRITLRLRGRHQPLEGTERTMCGVSEPQCSRPGTMDQDDAFKKEAIRQDWLRRLRPRPTRAACGV
ncbi:hypothetical protein N7509_000094 [Penicillium cosmopolitanum]|uniref:Uncharacterized protein n=1 Tax=Penicillium cosmopolitanum TaxID=1131564 RepID=A0A9W9WCM5_9EURO|nr:uncharacterized protein N7509_000094 [Penicillium cosmopolitanum]KAJ5414996.1 hypothetical protein N7509_000094 [Penicillium cosmopolitanum]